jgi:Flp pilus assembly protein TadG
MRLSKVVLMTTLNAFRDLVSRFKRNDEGQIAVIFALTLIPTMTAIGAAVDYSRANSSRTGLQAALDIAVLAAAKDGTSNWTSVAQNAFNSNLAAKGATGAAASFTLANSKYSGVATATVPTAFMGLIGINFIPVSVHSSAAGASIAKGACLITLDTGKSVSDTGLTFNGAPNVNMSGCAIRSNTSLNCNGHSGGALASIAVGTASGCSNPQSNASPIPDIYAALAKNITTACGSSTPGATWSPGSPPLAASMKTISRGSYTEYHVCGDLTLSGSGYLLGNAPSSDAVIIIENGSLTLANSSSINTVRTTIVLTGNNSSPSAINFPNGNGTASTLSLSPSTDASNPWQGVALYQDPSLTNGVDDSWGPGATFNADGVVYLPKANVTTKGNSASNNSSCTVFVTNTFTTNGSINLTFSQTTNGCSNLSVKQYTGTGASLTQ